MFKEGRFLELETDDFGIFMALPDCQHFFLMKLFIKKVKGLQLHAVTISLILYSHLHRFVVYNMTSIVQFELETCTFHFSFRIIKHNLFYLK